MNEAKLVEARELGEGGEEVEAADTRGGPKIAGEVEQDERRVGRRVCLQEEEVCFRTKGKGEALLEVEEAEEPTGAGECLVVEPRAVADGVHAEVGDAQETQDRVCAQGPVDGVVVTLRQYQHDDGEAEIELGAGGYGVDESNYVEGRLSGGKVVKGLVFVDISHKELMHEHVEVREEGRIGAEEG